MNKELYHKIAKAVFPSGVPFTDTEGIRRFTEAALFIDPYFLFRQAIKEGKKIEIQLSDNTWIISPAPIFSNPPEKYRIKVEEPKAGDYYRHSDSRVIYILTTCLSDKKLINIKTGYPWSVRQDDAFGGDFDKFEKVDLEINLKNK